eukprot:3111132-Amphidinium_carterae.1
MFAQLKAEMVHSPVSLPSVLSSSVSTCDTVGCIQAQASQWATLFRKIARALQPRQLNLRWTPTWSPAFGHLGV